MRDHDFNIVDSEVMCLLRLKYDVEYACEGLNRTKELLNNESMEEGLMSFYKYSGASHHVGWVLDTNLGTGSNPKLRYLRRVSHTEFLQSKKRQFVYEVIIEDCSDALPLQFILIMLQYLEKHDERYRVIFSAGKEKGHRYSALRTSDYYRLIHSLYFFSNTHGNISITNCIRMCIENPKDQNANSEHYEGFVWVQHMSRFTEKDLDGVNAVFGRIIPSIPITRQSYYALSTAYCEQEENVGIHNPWIPIMISLCRQYKEKLRKTGFISDFDFLQSDNILEALVFLSTYYYIIQEKESKLLSRSADYALTLHEECSDYTQGIMQLVENIVIHVLGENENEGCGVLTIRYRTKNDASLKYYNEKHIKNKEEFQEVEYFFEAYVTDFCYQDFKGIVRKFLDNVKKRMDESENDEDRIVNFNLYKNQCDKGSEENMEFLPYNPIDRYTRNESRDNVNMSLSDLFCYKKGSSMAEYLSCSRNIAFHYGLQILYSVIITGYGFFYVKSGIDESKDSYHNGCNCEGALYRVPKAINYKYGTTYTICLPIRIQKRRSFLDSVAVLKDQIEQEYDIIEYHPDLNDSENHSKEESIRELSERIEEVACKIKEDHKAIVVINCDKISCSSSNMRKQYLYEVLAKALFLCIVNNKIRIENIAITNLESRYDVIKVFRQFALFFDRNGESQIMRDLNRSSSVFIVDCNATTDVLFYGDNLHSIEQSLAVSQLYGGTDERAMLIVKHLAEMRGSDDD